MKMLLPLHAMAENFGLVSKSLRPKLGRKSYFTPEGKVALMFLKMYTGLSCPKLMEQLNGNIHYQMFCDVIIDPDRPLTNYKLLDDIMLELAGKLKIQQLQDILAEQWKQRKWEGTPLMPEPTTETAAKRRNGKTLSERNLPG